MAVPRKHITELYALLASPRNAAESKQLFDDLLTPQERAKLAERWQLVKLLASGMPQRKVAKKLNISISKVTRGSRALQYGTGGFKKYLKKKVR